MRMIIDRICGGGAKSLKYLLAGMLALVGAETAQAAYQAWVGSGSSPCYWDEKANWNYNSSGWKTSWTFPQNGCYWNINKSLRAFNSTWNNNRTITFKTFDSSNTGGTVRIDDAPSSGPIKFVSSDGTESKGYNGGKSLILSEYTAADAYLEIQSGKYVFGTVLLGNNGSKTGSLKITGGAFQGSTIAVGNTSSAVGRLTVEGSTAKATATGKISLNNGSVSVKSGGKLTCQTWFAVGSLASKTGTLEIDGGEVETTANRMTIGDVDNSTGIVKVKNGGKYSNTGTSTTGLTVGQKETGTLEVDGGEVALGARSLNVCAEDSSTATVTIKNGGVVTTGGVTYGAGTGGATITIDGGTIQAGADNAEFIPALANLNVYIGANGATIDANDKTVTISENLQNKSGEVGTVRFTGGGAVMLAGAVGWTGATTLDAGTAIGVTSANKADLLANLTVAIPAAGAADGAVVLTNTTDAAVFDQGDIAAITLTGTQDGRYALALADGGKTIVITDMFAGEYVWNDGNSGMGWKDAGKWSKNGEPGDWHDSTAAVFANAGDAVAVDSAVTAASVTFRANATVGGTAALTVPEISVRNGVSATVNAPTAGALVKKDPGTLTLGAARTDQTTLSEGTLVMSGEGTTLDWTKFTFGTDPLKPVTLKFENGATLVNISPMQVIAENMDITLVKECGDWNVTGNFQFPNAAGMTAKFYHKGGTLTASEYLVFGDHKDANPTYAEISGGTVRCSSTDVRAIIASSCDATVVVTNSGTLATAGNLLIANTAVNGTLTVEDGGTVDVAGDVVFGWSTNTANGVINLNGGVLSAKMLKRNKECSPRLNFNGGTLKAKDNGDLIYTTALAVTAGEEGGVIDANGKTVTLKSAISGTGGMTFKGGGTVTLASGNTYTGATTVELGTTVNVSAPGEIGGGLAVALPSVPASGIYTLATITGGETFEASVIEGVTHPAGMVLRLSADEKSVLCFYGSTWIGGDSGSLNDATKWANGAVPGAGANCVIGNAAAASLTNPSGSAFAPSSITFAADSAAIMIDGDAEITGIAAVTNLSSVSHTINVPVRFTGDIRVKQAAMAETGDLTKAHITFAGGAYAAPGCAIESGDSSAVYSRCMFGEYHLAPTAGDPWSARYQGSQRRVCLADNSTLYVPYAGIWTELYVGTGSKVFVGDMTMAHSGSTNHRVSYQNYGEVVVTNLTLTGTADRFCTYNQPVSSPSVFKFNSITNKMTTNWFYFGDKNCATAGTYYIGEGGLNFENSTSCYCLGGSDRADNKATLRPWYSNFTIQDVGGGNRGLAFDHDVEICTDDESSNGRTITINAKTYARNNPTITVSGSGTLKVNNTNDNAAQPTVTVKDTATLAFAAGASLGTGPLVLGAGTTLVVASDDLPISVASLALPESGTATIQIAGDAAFADGDYEIIASGAILPTGFAEKINLVLPDGTITTRRLYTSDGGTLKLFIGDGNLPDPYTWTGAANDGKMNTPGNWRGNAVPPVGAKVIIPPTAGTLDNNIEGFAPASITFGYGDGAVTIGGNTITGIAAITNNSAATHTINVPVAFADKILVVQGAMSWEQKDSASIRFAGGVTGSTFADGTARYLNGAFDLSTGAGWVANTQGSNNRWGIPAGAWLTTLESTDTKELNVGDDSNVGAAFTTGVHRTSSRICCYNYGEYVVTNELVAAYLDDVTVLLCGYDNISNGKFKFEKMTLDKTSNAMFKFGNSNSKSADTGTQQFYIGNGGLCFAEGAHQTLRYEAGGGNGNNATVRIDPWHGDYTIHTKEAADPTDFTVSAKTYFGTTDEGGNACTVTDDGVIASYDKGVIHIDGTGTFVVNAVGIAKCAASVEDTATLAINAGKKLTTGAMTVNSNATLQVAQSGKVTLGGDLTLKNGACLGFNFTGRNAEPQLALDSGKTLSFSSEGATTNITVKVSGVWPKRGTKTLTSCGGFTGVNVTLADGAPEWVEENSLKVGNDGNIVLTVKPLMTMILVR